QLGTLQGRVTYLEEQLDAIPGKATQGKEDPTVQRLTRELEAARSAVEARRQKLRPKAVAQTKDKLRKETEAAAAAVRDKILLLQTLEKTLEADLKRLGEETRPTELTRQFTPEPNEAVQQQLSQLTEEVRQLRAVVDEMRRAR